MKIIIERGVQIFIGAIGVAMCLHWYGWRMLVTLMFLTWSNNLMLDLYK